MVLQADLKSNGAMELIPIGEAARRVGLNASALRYYEERGLVRPAGRERGRRVYGSAELRRLVFVQLLQRLGVGLDTAATVLDEPSDEWRAAVAEQLATIEELIARAMGAKEFLEHALDCPADQPVDECPHMIETLERMLSGLTFEELAAEHGASMPVRTPKQPPRRGAKTARTTKKADQVYPGANF
jgi:DNA-binding transcriptional MerR regulator